MTRFANYNHAKNMWGQSDIISGDTHLVTYLAQC